MVNTGESQSPLSDSGLRDDGESSVSPRDSSILRAIQEEGLSVFTFDGLRRLLGLHQETLSRVLARLEDEGLVEKVPEGYRVTRGGSELVARPLSSGVTRVPLVQSLLPEDVDVDRIVSGLKGRWFGSLRWLGYSQSEEGVVLRWITEDDGIQVDAKFTDGFLAIEAKVGEGKEVSRAVKAAHQLLGYVSRLYNPPRQAGRFASPVAYYPDLGFDGPVTWS